MRRLRSSDGQCLIPTWTARDYAEHRAYSHFADFQTVSALARRYAAGEELSAEDWSAFGSICDRDRVFPEVDLHWYRTLDRPAIA